MDSSRPTPDDSDLADLIKRCAHGDEKALPTLYESLAAWLLGIANRLVRDRSVAEEVVQDAFMQVWRHADRFDPTIGTALAWIVGIVRYRAIDRLREEGCRIRSDLEIGQAEVDGLWNTLPPAFCEEKATLRRCLDELKDNSRRSIVLSYVYGCNHAEIAKLLGGPVGTVKSWIGRGLKLLKECFER
jgi:RNA polymerase sigma-70 factor, ECF subfamily